MVSRFLVGKDGRTAYERRRGRKCQIAVVPFGERVWYLKANSAGKNKFESRWGSGIWIGTREEGGESIIGFREGVIKARTFKREAILKERWRLDRLQKVKGVPWQPEH